MINHVNTLLQVLHKYVDKNGVEDCPLKDNNDPKQGIDKYEVKQRFKNLIKMACEKNILQSEICPNLASAKDLIGSG